MADTQQCETKQTQSGVSGDVREASAGCWHIVNGNWNSTCFGPDYCRKQCVYGTLYCENHQRQNPNAAN